MNFELSPTQEMARDFTREFARREIRPVAAAHDREASIPWEIMAKAKELGFSGHDLSLGESAREAGEEPEAARISVLGAEELAWGCAGITIAATATSFAAAPVRQLGSAVHRALFRECLSGLDGEGHVKVAANCLTEPGAGSDLSLISTTAVRDGRYYVLDGEKQFATNGSIASLYIVWATLDRGGGREAVRAFMVPRETPGVYPGRPLAKMGIRASDTAPVAFERCRVPDWHMLGARAQAYREAKGVLDRTRALVGAMAVGIARAALEYAVEYAKDRVQFSAPIASKQGIAFMLAEMATSIEAARALVWRAAWMADRGIPNAHAAAMAKMQAAAVAMQVTERAVQILGGYGYVQDHPVEKWMRDAKVMDIFEGTGQILRSVVAEGLTGIRCR